jgi:hypothetical protein
MMVPQTAHQIVSVCAQTIVYTTTTTNKIRYLMTTHNIRIKQSDITVIKEHIKLGHKIAAIKHARGAGKQYPPTENGVDVFSGETKYSYTVGLKCAKDAVEVLMGQCERNAASALFVPMIKILSFKVETVDGVVEVDVDELRIRLLDGMSEMSISEMGHMTDLAMYIAKWQGDEIDDS